MFIYLQASSLYWLKDAEIEEAELATHSSSKGARSQTSKSRSSSSHSCCKSKVIEGEGSQRKKAKLAELIAETDFLQN